MDKLAQNLHQKRFIQPSYRCFRKITYISKGVLTRTANCYPCQNIIKKCVKSRGYHWQVWALTFIDIDIDILGTKYRAEKPTYRPYLICTSQTNYLQNRRCAFWLQKNPHHCPRDYTQRNLSEILLNQPEIRLYPPFYD